MDACHFITNMSFKIIIVLLWFEWMMHVTNALLDEIILQEVTSCLVREQQR